MLNNKKSWKHHFDQGMAYGRSNDLHRAIESFQLAISIAPDEPYPHYELGYTLFLQGHYQKALDEFNTTNRLAPGFFLVQREIYLCEMVLRGYISQEALEIYYTLQQLSDAGRSQSSEVIQLSAKAIELDSSGALGYYYLGKALIHNDNEQAEKALYTCLRNSPDDTTAIDAKVHLGLIRQAKGNLSTAHCIWHSVLVHYRDNPHAKFCATLLSLDGNQAGMSMDVATSMLRLYGVEKLLSDQDDPRLWASVFSKIWLIPFPEEFNKASLRFGIGEPALDTEWKIQLFEAWSFEYIADNLLQVKEVSDDISAFSDSSIDKNLKDTVNTVLFCLPFAQTEYPRSSIVITRPSKGETEAYVYSGWQYAHLFGNGATHKWVYKDDGIWEQTGEPIGCWRS